MLKAIEFKGFIAPERASSMCFRVAVDDKREWVVRAKKSGYNAKRLFKEYFAGVLALEYGLSRPAVTTISIDDSVLRMLDPQVFDHACSIGTATEYIKGLEPVPPPSGSDNLNYLKSIFGQEYKFDQFYGFKLFADWVLLSDIHKYEILHVTPHREPVFLDLDLAFFEDDINELVLRGGYDWAKMLFHQHLSATE